MSNALLRWSLIGAIIFCWFFSIVGAKADPDPGSAVNFSGGRYHSDAAPRVVKRAVRTLSSRVNFPTAGANARTFSDANGNVIAGRPAGCPHQYCGCASCERVGISLEECKRRGLFKASSWYRFPASHPGPGMAEVRPHHVRIIISANGNGTATFYDPNSGGGLTRIHTDAIRGKVVNPNQAWASR